MSKLRELSGLSQGELADRVGSSAASVSRWENGVVTPKRAKVELDRELKAGNRLVRVWEPVATGLLVPPWMRTKGALEEKAVEIDTVTVSNLVPGLPQSLMYARMVFRAGNPSASNDQVEHFAQLRVARYEVLTRKNDPSITAVFPMSALTCLPDHVRIDQVKTILRSMERERLAAHLIPDGTPILLVASSIQVHRLADGTAVAASDYARGNLLMEQPEDTAAVVSAVRNLIGLCSLLGATSALLGRLL
ncbi:Scr1 family TA system antitoxin-like transcriptional regulator [Nocardiopsis sp. B62]|uniref:Scr1 family TA system antitoxin-like transcriptional regulator n=1 Tax=Nocardiopsis sp. B62 TaxID=2824874 RepID=UPI002495A117|nr:Scr1 family TA system antitoxin-like transcriptional regulator [Nocardiopsis sp. B62]